MRWDHVSTGRLPEDQSDRQIQNVIPEVAAHERWSLTRASNYSDFTEKILIFGKVVYIFARFMTMREK